MQKYKSLFFSLLLFVYACSGDKVPKSVINQHTMIGLLTEVHIADGSMFNTMQVPDSLYKYGTARYLKVFQNFHTDSVQFKKSMKFYSGHPELLEKIYEQVDIIIKKKTDSLNKINTAQIARDTKRRNDSLKKLSPKPAIKAQPVPVKPHVNGPPSQKFNNKRYLPKLKKNVVPIK